MAHFYLDEALASSQPGDLISLGGTEARHAVTVSRIRVGEQLAIGNGAGLVVRGTVVEADASKLTLEAATVESVPRAAPELHLAQALAKGDRDEAAVQAATELGVDGVIPWAAQRSIVKWEGARLRKGHDRWRAIVREASKQSVRAHLPEVHELMSTGALAGLASHSHVLVLEPTAALPLAQVELDGRDIVLVVGPEGGIAESELSRFEGAGATAVRLGDGILRTSTAGPAAIAVLSARLGRW